MVFRLDLMVLRRVTRGGGSVLDGGAIEVISADDVVG